MPKQRKTAVIKKVLKRELVSNRKYKTTYKDIKKYFEIINKAVFNKQLSPFNEILIKKIAKKIGFKNISCSHEVCPIINFTSRGYTTLVDAYLNPIIKNYIQSIENNLTANKIYYMQSNGLLTKKNYLALN